MVMDPVTLFSTPFEAGDSVRLWVNSQATSVIKNIYPGEENDRIFMELLWGVMKDGLNTLYYEVTRVSGNKDKSDPILNVLFNNPVCGIAVTHPPSIGQGQPATFTLTRDYPREYDVMTLTVGRWSKTIPYVHPANPVTYTLTTLDLQQIGDGTRSVSATNEDQLSNLRVSPTTSITINTAAAVLVTFTNAPYTATAGGQVTGIELILTQNGQPVVGPITVTLPTGTTFADGTSVGNFVTGSDGKVRLVGVTASSVAGTSSITAVSGGSTASAVLTITAQVPLGPIGVSPSPRGITLSPDGARAYVTGTKVVQVIDIATSTLEKPIPLLNYIGSYGIATNADATMVYACNVDVGLGVSIIDTRNENLIRDIPLQGSPSHMIVNNDHTRAFVTTYNGNSVALIDLSTSQFLKSIPVGQDSFDIKMARDGKRIYVGNVANGHGRSISVIDSQLLTVIQTITTPVAPIGIAISPDGRRLYVIGSVSTQTLFIEFDAYTGAQIRSLAVELGSRGLELNHAGTLAYCFQTQSNTVTPIDLMSWKIGTKISVGNGPIAMAISADDSLGYVPCLYGNAVWVIPLQGMSSSSLLSAQSLSMAQVYAAPVPSIPGDP
jgi:YVTN family beta-propeller protein